MAYNDEWCDLCNDKLKSVLGTISGRKIMICNHCATLAPEFKEEVTLETTRD